MGKRKDLTGQKFGKWTVLERAEDIVRYYKGRPNGVAITRWLCRCDCGTVKIVEGTRLTSGKTKGCQNCCRPASYVDLTGQRFGRLTVVCEMGKGNRNRGELLWYCECDCGGNATVLTSNLKRGNTKSCGCYFRECIDERSKVKHVQAIANREQKQMQAEANRERKFVDKFNRHYGHAFEYVEGYNSHDAKHPITIRCKVCGETKQRKRRNIFEDGANVACGNCNNNRKGLTIAICKECGKEYKQYSPQQTLCKECHDKQERVKRNTRQRLREAKAKENGKVDYSITLARLIERDKGICQLCGMPVDEEDYIFVGDAFVAGNNYPSIDHIKPLSKGGVHQWDNVQLAHRICNSLKCDDYET